MGTATKTKSSPAAQVRSQFSEQAHNEDLDHLSETDLDALAAGLWDWASKLEGDERKVRIRTATGADGQSLGVSALEVAGPDMPFLVDSLLGECAAQSLPVRALLHPVVILKDGARRSVIQIHLPLLDENEGAAITLGARRTIDDIAAAVADYPALRARMREEAQRLEQEFKVDAGERGEAVAFLSWLANDHFVFLGARTYVFETDEKGNFKQAEPEMVEGSNLGLLRDEERNVLSRDSEPTVLTPAISAYLQQPEPLIINKSNLMSRVHRRVYADYVGVKHYDDEGRVVGETRFAGLFTAEAYNEPAASVPLLRRRMEKVVAASGVSEGGHSEKALTNILETWPRDELFQTSAERLKPMALGALALVGRPRTRLFVRADRFGRYVSALVYVPRDAYDTGLRKKIGDRLCEAYEGRLVGFQPRFDDGPLLRVRFVLVPGKDAQPDVSLLEADIVRLCYTWDDTFRDAVSGADLSDDDRHGAIAFRGGFNAAYREAFSPEEALLDVSSIAELSDDRQISLRAYRKDGANASSVQAKIYARGVSIPLSKCVPVFENMGLFVKFETGYPVRPASKPVADAPDTYWVHALSMQTADGTDIDLTGMRKEFEDAFAAVWNGEAENDGFNRLIFTLGASWREAALLRTLCAYRGQTGMDPARITQINALANHPNLTGKLLALFAAKFDPDAKGTLKARKKSAEDIRAEIDQMLVSVSSLDEDRVIRRLADLIMAVQRTNFYQPQDKHGFIAVKIASGELEYLPEPKPYREIFTSSPRVNGVHCRFGPVARGGLRWSDRRDDFRTEVLGLVKAQQVKNAVIVPVGSKGGFFPKQLPVHGTREEIREGGIAAYKEFITALLSITDNLIDGDVQHPEETVIWDGEDPYLVVAADKGTATFSDIANEISVSHGFWLGDAFASGGSAGYDHKKMGITARGAWEAVKRHFREMGKDIQTEPFTVIGVGDMSGDVFGNGMLLSKEIRLQAAFNHLHIFVDPDPQDAQKNWEERKRIFDLPRSSWEDYNTKLISKGGGIFDRSAKSIDLTDEIKTLTGLSAGSVTPDELLHALLKAECDLLWFGGIGTYIKASHESHAAAGDRANDGIRVDGNQLKAKVIGEGANLGTTQAGRIEFALKGGRINTDAIDNSAGVDSSDHEVNIKILCSEAMRRGDLPSGERNTLLASMTDDVAAHVLQHNYDQTGALTLTAVRAKADHAALERTMVWLEKQGVLNRRVEGLPASDVMSQRAEAGKWLTRPELSVILAWSKIVLFDEISQSDLPDDPHFAETLKAYFPSGVHGYDEARQAHRLKREIIATVLANRLLDAGGPAMLTRLREMSGAGGAEITRAFEVARLALGADALGDEVNALDNKVNAGAQTAMQLEIADALERATLYYAGQRYEAVQPALAAQSSGLSDLRDVLSGAMKTFSAGRVQRRVKAFTKLGAPEPLAGKVANLPVLTLGPYILRIASESDRSVKHAAEAFFALGESLQIDRLRTSSEDGMDGADYWNKRAARGLISDLLRGQADAATRILASAGAKTGGAKAAAEWLIANKSEVTRLVRDMQAIGTGKNWSFAKLSLVAESARSVLSKG